MPLLKAYNKLLSNDLFSNIPIFVGYVDEKALSDYNYETFIVLIENTTKNTDFASNKALSLNTTVDVLLYTKGIKQINYFYFKLDNLFEDKNSSDRFCMLNSHISFDTQLKLPILVKTYMYKYTKE